jgi:hypothetical protein
VAGNTSEDTVFRADRRKPWHSRYLIYLSAEITALGLKKASRLHRCDFRRRDPADNPGDRGFLRFVKVSEQARLRACCRPPSHPPDPIDGCPQKTSASACGFSEKHPPQPIDGCPHRTSSFWCRVADHMCHGQVPLSVWSGMATLVHRLFTLGVVAHALLPTGAGW